eukprot:CAMPEP_0117033182 /NCGR_PEP_ID=MMETSP0472-20121206/23734_1 /TAXON_ID=693140 ORGANISM="Tiarina fusus, Strain LIS" /NCGR_SAMPLE_ID=MMETSP0472 /ASSEMBLY_ACC=CAM_ASM_000603 /LENGTH=288 /DNA_ID=CAMNT_0004742039 /DNA_START=33 /DNA_END=896 /DNA_ORIENTATION=-
MGCSERKMTAGLQDKAVLQIDRLKGPFEEKGGKNASHCRSIPPDYSNVPFPLKLHAMLDDAARYGFEYIVSWECEGRAFMVHDIDGFVNRVLHQYFNQTRYKSFQRQLNIYGFKRVARGREKGMCFHTLFLRGQSRLCIGMQRVKVKEDPETLKAQTILSKPTALSDSDDSSDGENSSCKGDNTFDIACFEGKTFYLVDENQEHLDLSENFGSPKKTPEADAPHIRPHNNCRNDSFPWKLYDLLEKVESSGQSHIISWENDGKALKVHKPDEFGKNILPAFFLHTKKW